MSTQDIVEAWEQEKVKVGFRKALTATYEARFGAMPAEFVAKLREMRDEAALQSLLRIIATGTPEQLRDRLFSAHTR